MFSWTASLKPLRDILPLFLITRLIIIAAIYLPLLFHLYIYPVSSNVYQGTPLLDPLARWDAEWYLRIADQGYHYTPGSVVQTESYTGFFPLYPLLVRVTGQLTGDPLVGGLLISSASFLAALVYLYHLQALWYSKEEAGRAIWYLMVFPTSFFFSMAYTESLFFLLTVMAAYYARRQKWLVAAALTGLAGACRMPGVLMLIIIGYEWALTKGWSLGNIRSRAAWSALAAGLRQDAGRLLLVITLAVSGVVAYLVYLAVTYGNAFAFMDSALNAWGPLSTNPVEATLGAIVMVGKFTEHRLPYFGLLELAAVAAALALAVYVGKRYHAGYAVYCLGSLYLTSSAYHSGQLRYVIVLFPLFMGLALFLKTHRRIQVVYMSISLIFLPVFAYFYANWVFIG